MQLINAATDEHLWAETYDRELSVENLFEIQSEIAQIIAQALSVTLSADERERIQQGPTDNLEAFYAYNRGKQLFVRSTFESLRESLLEFERALEPGPNIVEVLDIYSSFLRSRERHLEAIGSSKGRSVLGSRTLSRRRPIC